MALSINSTPNINVSGYDSDVCSTEQLLYSFTESVLTGKNKYRLEVVIPEANNTTFYFLADSSGSIDFDLGPAMALLIPDGQTWLNYKLTYRGVWDGGSDTPADSDFTLAIFSRRQILSQYGANLYNKSMKSIDKKAEFLSVFEEPKIWNGWTQKASLINPAFSIFDIKEASLNINKAFIQEDLYKYTSQAVKNIFEHTIIADDIVSPSIPHYFNLIAQEETTGVTKYSESITYKYETPCRNPIMIEWVNSLGAWESWLFQYNQTFTNIAGDGLKYETPIVGTIESKTGNKGRAVFKDTQFITLKADQLTQNQLQGLHDIKRSYNVRVWLDRTGTNYVKAIVSGGYDTSFTSGKLAYEFSLNLELPDNFDFFTAKEYFFFLESFRLLEDDTNRLLEDDTNRLLE